MPLFVLFLEEFHHLHHRHTFFQLRGREGEREGGEWEEGEREGGEWHGEKEVLGSTSRWIRGDSLNEKDQPERHCLQVRLWLG